MTTLRTFEVQSSKFKKGAAVRRVSFLTFALCTLTSLGCQQKMATQPAPRPYETNETFRYSQSARPLEKGVVHRNQRLEDDPLMTWLTPEARKSRGDVKQSGDASFDPKSVVAPVGAPEKVEFFVKEIPFDPTETDLKRGQSLYNAACALCHGAAGYGNGKIAERGFLRPPSYHTDPAGKEMDWSTYDQPSKNEQGGGLPAGYSRGFYRWGVKVPLKDVPLGYFVQVISWGYGGMASHDTQLPDVVDRWRVAAYVRTLQYSQSAAVADLPADVKQKLDQPAAAAKGEGHK